MLEQIPFQYYFTMDDTILPLEQLTNDDPDSIFENEYFSMLKEIHDNYGTKFNLGLFYKTSNSINLGNTNWNLTMMTDKYKNEFQDNSDWLKFSFHAWEFETEYYSRNRDVYDDLITIKNEALRFAGESSWIENYICIHFYMGTQDQLRKLTQKLGKKVVLISRANQLNGRSSYLSQYKFDKLRDSKIYFDDEVGILHLLREAVIERVLGENASNDVHPDMKTFFDTIKNHRFIDVGSHEYFFIKAHERYSQKVVDGLYDTAEWMYKNNYKSTFPDADLYYLSWQNPTNLNSVSEISTN